MQPCVLRVATISFALTLCASTPARAQPVCVGDEDVCGEWGDVKEWGFDTTHMILLETGDVLCIGEHSPVEVGIYHPNPDPLLVDAAARDYRLQSTSPCRDAGNTSLLPKDSADLDWDGITTSTLGKELAMKSRVSGTGVDIGAYESTGP